MHYFCITALLFKLRKQINRDKGNEKNLSKILFA